jgi:hypothetical protein
MFPDGVPSIFLGGSYKGVGFKHLDPAVDGTTIMEGPGQESGFKFDRSWPLDAMINSFIIWNGIVKAYTKCTLTKAKDRLIAISAIAKQFQPQFKDEYIAGLWKRHLAQHLLWKVDFPRAVVLSTTNSESYIAPSWSWASVNGPVTPYTRISKHDKPVMIEILEANVETETADKTGQVSRGHIKARGWLKQFPPPEEDHDGDDSDDSDDGDIDEATWKFKTSEIDFCYFFPDQLPLPADPKWYCLPVLETAEEDQEDKEGELDRTVHGLVLLETEKENENEYRRVGTFMTMLDSYKAFKRPTYPFRTLQTPKEDDIGSPSVQEVQAKIETNRTTSKRRLLPFFSRKGQDEESQAIKGQEQVSGRGEWWRFGRQKNQWVEHVITII